MKLFNVINQRALPTTEILLVSPFDEIWNRDITESKFYAIKDFTYIELLCSPKKTNPFYGYDDPKIRSEKVIENLNGRDDNKGGHYLDKKWQPDAVVIEACKQYRTFLYEASPSLSFLESAITAMTTLKDWFSDVDLSEKNAKGALLYKPVDITRAMEKIEPMMKSIHNLRQKVEQELYETTKTLKNREINPFEEAPLTDEEQDRQ